MRQTAGAPVSAVPASASPLPVQGLLIRRMGLQDLAFVSAAHQAHFGDGFFARLGPRFLARYYRTFLDGPTAVALIAEMEGTRCGYLTGVLHTREHRKLLLRYHGPALAVRGSVAMALRPRVGLTFLATRLPRYVRGLRRGLAPQSTPTRNSPGGQTAVLTHIVVDEPHRKRGVGRQLVDRFLAEAGQAGCTTAALVTLAEATGAAQFYEAHGWTRCGDVTTPEGKHLWRYTIPLHTGPT